METCKGDPGDAKYYKERLPYLWNSSNFRSRNPAPKAPRCTLHRPAVARSSRRCEYQHHECHLVNMMRRLFFRMLQYCLCLASPGILCLQWCGLAYGCRYLRRRPPYLAVRGLASGSTSRIQQFDTSCCVSSWAHWCNGGCDVCYCARHLLEAAAAAAVQRAARSLLQPCHDIKGMVSTKTELGKQPTREPSALLTTPRQTQRTQYMAAE